MLFKIMKFIKKQELLQLVAKRLYQPMVQIKKNMNQLAINLRPKKKWKKKNKELRIYWELLTKKFNKKLQLAMRPLNWRNNSWKNKNNNKTICYNLKKNLM